MPKEEKPTNQQIAAILDEIADLLENSDSNPYRVNAYREGAQTIRDTNQPVADLAQRGDRKALIALPGIGEGLAGVIFEYVVTGRSEVLENLREQQSSPPVEQEKASNKDSQKDKQETRQKTGAQPSIAMLFDVDAEYRQKAEAGELRKLAPRRNNPENEAWLPVLKTKRGPWRFTVLFSNTAKAHEQGRTDDWVVIYFDRGEGEDQVTVVTEYNGPLSGRRVVRGREQESAAYYQKAET